MPRTSFNVTIPTICRGFSRTWMDSSHMMSRKLHYRPSQVFITLDTNEVTRAIEDPLVLRQLKFAQDFQRRFCAARVGDERVPVSEAGRDCQDVHSRPFLVASRRCGCRPKFLKKHFRCCIPQSIQQACFAMATFRLRSRAHFGLSNKEQRGYLRKAIQVLPGEHLRCYITTATVDFEKSGR